jgi:hypothetical protein
MEETYDISVARTNLVRRLLKTLDVRVEDMKDDGELLENVFQIIVEVPVHCKVVNGNKIVDAHIHSLHIVNGDQIIALNEAFEDLHLIEAYSVWKGQDLVLPVNENVYQRCNTFSTIEDLVIAIKALILKIEN